MKILIAERNTDVAELAKMAFELDGHRVWTAATADEALRTARFTAFDSYLIDLGIEAGGGSALLKKLNSTAMRQHGRVAASAVAWDGSAPDEWEGQPHGFNCFLLKPMSFAHVLDALNGESCRTCGHGFAPRYTHAYCGPWPTPVPR